MRDHASNRRTMAKVLFKVGYAGAATPVYHRRLTNHYSASGPKAIPPPCATERLVVQKGTGLRFVLGGSRVGYSRFPPFQRWSQPGASSLDETQDLRLTAGDPLAGYGSKPQRSSLRHVDANRSPGRGQGAPIFIVNPQ